MSMRKRLTWAMVLLSGAAFILFAGIVYLTVTVVMLDWIDTRLVNASDVVLEQVKTYGPSQLDIPAAMSLPLDEIYVVQVWSLDGSLLYCNHTSIQNPLDDNGWQLWKPVFSTVSMEGGRERVLSIPIVSERGPFGMLMIGRSLTALDYLFHSLLICLAISALLAWSFTCATVWWLAGLLVQPLQRMTEVLPRILEAEDLSRRVPAEIAPQGEVGALIQMINNLLERLEQQLSSQRRFLSDVSHELRTPLTVIKGEVGLLRKFSQPDEESLSSIEAEVDRLTRLVGDLLLLGQAESGKLSLVLAPIDLDDLVMDLYQQTMRVSGKRLQVKLVEIEPVRLQADRDRLKQVLINLLGNAVQHTPPNGIVSLSLRRLGDRAQITVSDTGSGIPADDLPHIFERFYRGEKSRKRKPGGGFGLGLSISYWIVRTHGGTIDVSSQEGRGTTFTVWLPLEPPSGPVENK